MPDETDPPPPSALGGLNPEELFARGMNTVKMTGSTGAHGWEPPSIEEAARLFPSYEVLALLGRGGMGAVYQARQIQLDRLVAIKLLPLEISVDRDFADRFRREARAMAKLNHPNIISVFDFGQTGEGHLFFVMEFVEGANLHQLIHTNEPGSAGGLAPAQALEIIMGVCDALHYAHGKGVVHRDIKPANVMVSTEGQVKVADFGLARLTDPSAEQMGHTMTGTVMGTPDYMAPEQMRGMAVDHRADIYSLGVMLYEMLCKEVPRGFFDLPSLRVGVDKRIDAVVTKAMQQVPDRRYQSTGEMKTDVQAARTPLPTAPRPRVVAGPPPRPPQPAPKPIAKPPAPAKSNTLLIVGVSAGIVALIGTFLYLARPQPKRAAASSTSQPVKATAPSPSTDKVPRLSPSAEPWQDVLRDPAKLDLHGGAERMPGGLRFAEAGSAMLARPQRDGAVRMRATYGGLRVQLRARQTKAGDYQLYASAGGKMVALQRRDGDAAKNANLRDFPLREPLQPGQDYELELRVVGQILTAKLNGEVLGTVTDAAFPDGQFSVAAMEHEGTPTLVKSLEVLDLDAPAAAAEAGFRPLFDGTTLAGWRALDRDAPATNWRVTDGALTGRPRSCLMTQAEFADFDLRLEWRVKPQGNGGIFYHVAEAGMRDRPTEAIEFQLMDDSLATKPEQVTGSAFDVQAATEKAAHPPGEWNTARLLVQGSHVEHWVNDKLVCRYDLAAPATRDALQRAKVGGDFSHARKGRLVLQAWAGEVFYRNLRIRETAPVRPGESKPAAPAPPETPGFQISVASPAPPRLSPSAEPWRDAFKDPSIAASGTLSPNGLALPGATKFYNIQGASRGDGAVRVVVQRETSRHVALYVRKGAAGHYQLRLTTGFTVSLDRWDQSTQRNTQLKLFPQPNTKFVEMELRVVGSKISVKLNGTPAGEVLDTALTDGVMGVATLGDEPAVIQAFEYLEQ